MFAIMPSSLKHIPTHPRVSTMAGQRGVLGWHVRGVEGNDRRGEHYAKCRVTRPLLFVLPDLPSSLLFSSISSGHHGD